MRGRTLNKLVRAGRRGARRNHRVHARHARAHVNVEGGDAIRCHHLHCTDLCTVTEHRGAQDQAWVMAGAGAIVAMYWRCDATSE